MYDPIQPTTTVSFPRTSISRLPRHHGILGSLAAKPALLFLLFAAATAFGGSATWNLNPDGLWRPAHIFNWTPATTPNGPADTATFDVSNVTSVGVDFDPIEVNGIVFNPGASAFTISVLAPTEVVVSLTISGVGITNNSGITQNFVVGYSGGCCNPSDLIFTNSATTGDLTVFTAIDSGYYYDRGSIFFEDDSTADVARLEVFGDGTLDISLHNAPGVTIGSIEGDGLVFVGANKLWVGSNNLNTTFSGVIQDGGIGGGTGGSLTKIGTGTLTLTGANTYTGDTTIEGGRLVVNNMGGSGTGMSAVQVNAGTLAGRGTIAGAVTVGTGSGAGAVLAPGRRGGKPGNPLTIQSTLTFNSDATYDFGFNAKRAIADTVVADGVTVSGAQFHFVDRSAIALPSGTLFTAIDNTAATPITGTFSNLADGSTFTMGSNTFQASYEGGTGNDLTLTVVP